MEAIKGSGLGIDRRLPLLVPGGRYPGEVSNEAAAVSGCTYWCYDPGMYTQSGSRPLSTPGAAIGGAYVEDGAK